MINDLDTPEPSHGGIGHNLPPLGELLVEETQELRARIAEHVAAAQERAVVATEDDAEKATLQLAIMRELNTEADAARVARKAPYLEAGRQVDAHFADLVFPLVGPSPKQKMTGAYGELHARLDAYRRRHEAAAAAERQKLLAEARAQRDIAQQAERDRIAAEQEALAAKNEREYQRSRAAKLEAELAARKAADEAARLDARAEAAEAPAVIHSGYGPKATRRTVYRVEITDLSLALRHALRVDHQHKIREAVQAVCDRQLRAGVKDLPGCKIIEDSITQVRK
jgi:hypothetical protein